MDDLLRRDLHRLIDDVLDDDARIAVIAFRRLQLDRLPALERRVVQLARAQKWGWARIGRGLHRTRQSVHARFSEALEHSA